MTAASQISVVTDVQRALHFAERYAVDGLPGSPDLGGVQVGPLAGKAPAIAGGRGCLDFTGDIDQVRAWWGGRYRGANIGGCPPPGVVVTDVDPRNGGLDSLAALAGEHGQLPDTLTAWSGRGDGGRHLYWLRPAGKLSGRRLPAGWDLKTTAGYLVLPPSRHPASGDLYWWELPVVRVAAMPGWLGSLVIEPDPVVEVPPRAGGSPLGGYSGPSVVEQVNGSLSWADVLGRRGWTLVKGDGDSDGSGWRHPAATSPCSATIRGERLYVWSPNTPFAPSAPGEPRGYSRAEAVALLEFDGDLAALVAEVRRTGAIA